MAPALRHKLLATRPRPAYCVIHAIPHTETRHDQPQQSPRHAQTRAGRRQRPWIQWLGGGFGFNPATGEWFTANESALAVLGWQREGLAADVIAGRLAEFFDVSHAAAQRDLETFFASGMGSMFHFK